MTSRGKEKRVNLSHWERLNFRFQYLLIISLITHRIKLIKFLELTESEGFQFVSISVQHHLVVASERRSKKIIVLYRT